VFGSRMDQDAAREICLELEAQGKLTPDEVVTLAKDPASPLHEYFEWDVQKAAEEHWRNTARQIIRTFKVTFTYHDVVIRVPEFVHDEKKKKTEPGYVLAERAKSSADVARATLESALDTARAHLERAQGIAALLEMEDEATKITRAIEAL